MAPEAVLGVRCASFIHDLTTSQATSLLLLPCPPAPPAVRTCVSWPPVAGASWRPQTPFCHAAGRGPRPAPCRPAAACCRCGCCPALPRCSLWRGAAPCPHQGPLTPASQGHWPPALACRSHTCSRAGAPAGQRVGDSNTHEAEPVHLQGRGWGVATHMQPGRCTCRADDGG